MSGEIGAGAYLSMVRHTAKRAIDEGASKDDVLQVLAEVEAGQAETCAHLDIPPASQLASKPAPAPRDYICQQLALYAGRVATFMGNGGDGKTTIAQQLAVAVASSSDLWGMETRGGVVLGLFCEDEQDELDRKTRGIAEAEGIALQDLDDLYLHSRDGQDSVLAGFNRDRIELTRFYRVLDETCDFHKPRLLILDTLADIFAGDFMSTPHARQFVKIALGGLAARHGSAILLLAHPSAAGMASGSGAGFSTAWNNSVRSRLYLRRPKSEDLDAAPDRRVLEIMKNNYGATGGSIPLAFEAGRFVLDPDPLPEGGAVIRPMKADTRHAVAILAYFRQRASGGQIVTFRSVFDALQAAGEIRPGVDYEAARKPLYRTLKAMVDEGVLTASTLPKGYRLAARTES